VAFFAGWKFVVIILWLPLAAFLAWIFKPALNPTLLDVGVFFVSIWGAYLLRTMLLSLLGMITFWTTRVSAIYELFFALELILSGRLVPMSLMPDRVQQVSNYLPFKWAFQFPIESLVAHLSPQELLGGLGMQALWFLVGLAAVNVLWKYGIYSHPERECGNTG
jgi:ABC-2 type transport system permease protein